MTVMIFLPSTDPINGKKTEKRERRKLRHCKWNKFTERTRKSDPALLRAALSVEIRRLSDKRKKKRESQDWNDARTQTTSFDLMILIDDRGRRGGGGSQTLIVCLCYDSTSCKINTINIHPSTNTKCRTSHLTA